MEFATLAVMIERFVQMFVAPAFDNSEGLKPFKWVQMYVALVLGELLAFGGSLNVLTVIAPSLHVGDPVAFALTGVLLGGGSSFLHEFLDNIQQRQTAK